MNKKLKSEKIITQPRNKITNTYESKPNNVQRRSKTIEWLNQFNIKGHCLDCGDKSIFTSMLSEKFKITVENTTHDLDYKPNNSYKYYNNVFAFEVIEHLLNPLLFLEWVTSILEKDGILFISTPINRPNWLRNKDTHFHEFNFDELEFLVEKAGFEIIRKKIINCARFRDIFKGFRPIIRFIGFGRTVLIELGQTKSNKVK